MALNRTTLGFAMILIAALLAIAVAATHSEPPEVSHFAPPHAATAADR